MNYLHWFVLLFSAVVLAAIPQISYSQTYDAVLTLDPIPSIVKTGQVVEFSGRLATTDGMVVRDATIYIKDDVDFGPDNYIGSLTTDSAGRFSGEWTAQKRSSGSWDFYAVYEGYQNISDARSKTYTVTVSDNAESSYGTTSSSDIPTQIILDRLPSSAYAGNSMTFTGKLYANGKPLSNAPVFIKEDDPGPDDTLTSTRTDSNGNFRATWNISAGLLEQDFDIYAIYEGDSLFEKARSQNQIMSILKHSGSIVLDSIPSSAKIGQPITFSGRLSLNTGSPEGAIVYIKDEDPLNPDDLLATAYVDSSGRFSANWIAREVDEDGTADIFAVFEGNDVYYRLTTCDSGPTRSIGGLCADTIKLNISGIYSPTSNPIRVNGEYMELFYSLDFSKNPHVGIVPNPDSYDSAKRYITSAKEGILMWKSNLDNRYGGDWNIDFEVVSPGKLFFQSKPDVIVNLVTPENDNGCNRDYFGVTNVTGVKPVQASVCVIFNGKERSFADVSATSAHEFIHAIGLGHSFNKDRDLMCSVENGKETCSTIGKSQVPSSLNLAAVTKLYGTDGFKNPNNLISYKTKFALDTSTIDNFAKPIVEKPTDYDNDGIPDAFDKCVATPENFNGYLDTDGCPDEKPTLQKIVPDSDKSQIPSTNTEIKKLDESFIESLKNNQCKKDEILLNGNCVSGELAKLIQNSDRKPTLLKEIPAPFVDPSKDQKSYVKRYITEESYREWFGKNYPDYTFYEALGITQKQFDFLSDEVMQEQDQAKIMEEKTQVQCTSGTHLENGVCADNQKEPGNEKDVFSQFIDMIMSLFS